MSLIVNVLTEIFRQGITAGILVLVLISIGLYDLYRVYRKKDTISRKVQAWFPKWGDALVLIGILILVWLVYGPAYFVTVMLGCILGHFFWES